MAKKRDDLIGAAEDQLDRHTAPPRPGDRKYAGRGTGDDPAALREEQAAETAEPVLSAGPEHMTSGQWHGMVLGGAAGAVLGALLLLPLALVPFHDSVTFRLVTVAIAGALAGAAAGGVYWGGRAPELEGETVDADGRPSNSTTPRDPGSDKRGR
jgi:hypothetical protein